MNLVSLRDFLRFVNCYFSSLIIFPEDKMLSPPSEYPVVLPPFQHPVSSEMKGLREHCYTIIGFLEDEANSTLDRLELPPMVLVGRISKPSAGDGNRTVCPSTSNELALHPPLLNSWIQHQVTSEMSLLWSKKYSLSHPM